jgi:hypothetical protein
MKTDTVIACIVILILLGMRIWSYISKDDDTHEGHSKNRY